MEIVMDLDRPKEFYASAHAFEINTIIFALLLSGYPHSVGRRAQFGSSRRDAIHGFERHTLCLSAF
jgi:hypothetical protein